MPIITTIDNKVANVSIQRPEKRNTLNAEMCEELARQLLDCDKDPLVRAFLISGENNVFCAGLDLEQLMKDPEPVCNAFDKVIKALDGLTKPVVVAVGGPAVAQGAALLYHCDIVYCGEHALFSLPAIALGLTPEHGVNMLAVKCGGYKLAAQKILLSEPISPSEAIAMGLINNVFSDDKLMQQAQATASRLASLPPKAMTAAKALLKSAYFDGMKEQTEKEMEFRRKLLNGAESREAFQAFLEKRPPKFD